MIVCASAQTQSETLAASGIKADKNLIYRQKIKPEHIDNYLYSSFFSTDRKAYNMKGFEVGSAGSAVTDIKINPAGHSIAFLSGTGKKAKVDIRPLGHANIKSATIKGLTAPTAICYTPDSRYLAVADNGSVKLFDSRTFAPAGEIATGTNPVMMTASSDGFYIAAAEGGKVTVVNLPDKKTHQTLTLPATVVDIAFNPGAKQFGAVTSDRKLTVYSTPEFIVSTTVELPGDANALSFHPDGKYAAVATGGNTIGFYNLIDSSDRSYIKDPEGTIAFTRFVKDGQGNVYIIYNAPLSIKYKRVVGFATNYTKLLEDELNARMLEWSMMRPMETEDEYRQRVNDETRKKQRSLFANEITTGLAGDLIAHEDVTLGGYNPESGALTLSIGSFAEVYLTVGEEDLASFSAEDLEFRNSVYGLTADDNFELIYTEVYNKANGKTYRFDNLSRQNLDFLKNDDASLVPFEIMQQQSREAAKLQSIKEDVVEKALRNSSISEHTAIEVSSRLVPTTDASGKRINNYQVDFTYTVDPEYSDHEDFAPGRYRIEESAAAQSMLQIVNEAFENDLAGYLSQGKKVILTLTGTADAAPINRPIAYDGSFGEFNDEPCRVDNDLTAITVTPSTGIATNPQLAFMRAQAVRDHIMKSVDALQQMDVSVNYDINVSKERGGQFRRINVTLLFVDPY